MEKEVFADLTFTQKLALEGEVASCFDLSAHKQDEMYFTYIYLFYTDSKYHSYLFEEISKYMEEEDISLLKLYLASNLYPSTLWVKKFVADIKCYISSSENKEKPVKLSKPVIRSKFVNLVTLISNSLPTIVRELLQEILEEDSLEFLHEACNYLLLNIQATKDKFTEPKQIIKALQISLIDIPKLDFVRETELVESTANSVDETLNNLVQKVISEVTSKKTYCVNKIDKATKDVVFSKEFPSRTKAIEYLKRIGEDYPELRDRYDFVITEQQAE